MKNLALVSILLLGCGAPAPAANGPSKPSRGIAARSAPVEVVETEMAIDVTAEGKVIVDGREIESDIDLARIASATMKEDPNASAVLHADAAASHASVIHVIDILKSAGVTKVAIKP